MRPRGAGARLILAGCVLILAADMALALVAFMVYRQWSTEVASAPRRSGPRAELQSGGLDEGASPTPAPRAGKTREAAPTPRPPGPGVEPRVVTATPSVTPNFASTLASPPAPAVDWPVTPEVDELEVLSQSKHFRVYAADAEDALLVRAADDWDQTLEPRLAALEDRLDGKPLSRTPVAVVFARTYPGRCPARGLAAAHADPPLLMVFLDQDTPALQIRAVLAHEMAHHLTIDDDFVGDGVLTEGLANWAGGALVLRWQGFSSWPDAVRGYWRQGGYISITDDMGLSPQAGESCIARRDRVYNIRTAFVEWLVGQIGLPAVLAMPALEVRVNNSRPGEPQPQRLPDYERATGRSLIELERDFLLSLGLGRPEALLQLRLELHGVDVQ